MGCLRWPEARVRRLRSAAGQEGRLRRTAGQPSTSPGATNNGKSSPPQVLGPVYASLGEVYAHEGKVPEAQAAFHQAVAALPAQAAQYRGNETIVFFQIGQGDAEYIAAKQTLAPLIPTVPQCTTSKGKRCLPRPQSIQRRRS